jgi:RNA polymerase sigma factor (sigma-70 family)
MIYSNEGENVLWSQLLEGDEAAFARVYEVYFPILFQYCTRFTTDKNLVKDVLQDFFIGLFDGRRSPSVILHLKSYLMVSVRRELLKRLSRESRSPVEWMTGQEYEFHLELSPESTLINKQLGEHRSKYLQNTINTLTPRQREAVYLYFYENTSYEEIAEVMGLKEVKYARTLIYRAISELRSLLTENDSLLGQFIL